MKRKRTIVILSFFERIKRLSVFVACLFMLFHNIQAANDAILQQNSITGTITDGESGATLPGVNIVIKGTATGTVSDMEGKYQISASQGQTLVFSFIGYLTEEVVISNQSIVDISLIPDVTQLEEIVVIGYGVQAKKLVTGATAQVKGDELQKLSSTNALQALQGQAPGINITSESGQPGEGIKVTIRGLGTIGNASPLFIVDGVQTNDIKYLNNSDIESIDVLKDAASAAIYGSRAANGVVLITTRQGKSGKSQITFDAYYGYQNRAKKISTLNAKEYAMIINEQHLNSGGLASNLPFNVNNLPAYVEGGSKDYDWFDEMIVKNAVTQNYSLGASGGNEQTTYSMSLSYTGQEGIIGGRDKSNYERYNGRFNSENIINDRVKVGEHFTVSVIRKNGVQVGNIYSNTLRGAFNASPFIPIYDDEDNFFNTADTSLNDQFGNDYWNDTEANPYANMAINNQNLTTTNKILGDVYANIKILNNLNFKSTFGIDYSGEEYNSFTPEYQISLYALSTFSKVTQNQKKHLTLNMDNILSYDFNIGKHTFNSMIGMSARNYSGSYIQGENTNLAFNDLEHAYLNNATNTSYPNLKVEGKPYDVDRLLSYFGRVQYNFNETYLLNATVRADGSSKFAKSSRWGYFPSVSGGWVISNESFMLPVTSVINFLKIRASWGRNGNQNITAFHYLAPIAFTKATYAFGNTEGTSTPGSYPSRLSNEKLKWETSEQINIGFDSRFISSKLSVVLDLYQKSTKDWLIIAPVLATAGTEAPYINGGNVINKGVELGLSFNNHLNNFNYTINVNGAYNKNEVQEIPTNDGIVHGAGNTLYANSTEFYRAESGFPIGYFWGYETDGLFQEVDDVTGHTSTDGTIIQPNAKPGDVRYKDLNDDGKIDDDDKKMIGDPNPDFMYGLSFSCNYKAFDFLVLANGVAGNQIVQSYRDQDKYSNYTTTILDRWTGKGTSDEIPRVTNSNINYQFSELFIHNGSYLRISNITIGYDLAKSLKIKNLGQFRIYASVQNLYTLTKYNGMDPEIGYGFDHGDTDKFSSGIDLGYYPRPRTILIGASLKF